MKVSTSTARYRSGQHSQDIGIDMQAIITWSKDQLQWIKEQMQSRSVSALYIKIGVAVVLSLFSFIFLMPS